MVGTSLGAGAVLSHVCLKKIFFSKFIGVTLLWYIYTMEYYLAIKRRNLPFWDSVMDLESIMLSEISQSETDKYHMISLICEI